MPFFCLQSGREPKTSGTSDPATAFRKTERTTTLATSRLDFVWQSRPLSASGWGGLVENKKDALAFMQRNIRTRVCNECDTGFMCESHLIRRGRASAPPHGTSAQVKQRKQCGWHNCCECAAASAGKCASAPACSLQLTPPPPAKAVLCMWDAEATNAPNQSCRPCTIEVCSDMQHKVAGVGY